MKQLLFLLLFPCLCVAQYTGNAGQKITLGEQTTADGLVYRGLAADTTRKPSVDTMAYILLDTNTNIIWQYKKATNNAWTRLGGSISSGVTGVLPVANGGTGATSLSPNNYLIRTNSSGVFDTAAIFEAGGNVGIGTVSPVYKLDVNGNMRVSGTGIFNDAINVITSGLLAQIKAVSSNANGYSVLRLENTGSGGRFYDFGVGGNTSGLNGEFYIFDGLALSTRFKITSNGAITINDLAGAGSRAVVADQNGFLSAPVSSITTKENVQTLNYGLNEILKINPVSFNYINKDKWGEERNLGFILENMFPVIPEVTGTMNNGDMYLDMTKLIPILTKAIQEQNALIKALEQRILTLENK